MKKMSLEQLHIYIIIFSDMPLFFFSNVFQIYNKFFIITFLFSL